MNKEELIKLYNEGYLRGDKDVSIEAKKIEGLNLASDLKVTLKGSNKKITMRIDTLFSAAESAIKSNLLSMNDQMIENLGGYEKYINDTFQDSQKKQRSALESTVKAGYVDGRNELFCYGSCYHPIHSFSC